MKYEAEIIWHEDIEVHEFSDTYTMSRDYWDDESARDYIKRDLRIIAGGGYNQIANNKIVSLVVKRVSDA